MVMCYGSTCLKWAKYLDIPFINSITKCYLYEDVTVDCVKENECICLLTIKMRITYITTFSMGSFSCKELLAFEADADHCSQEKNKVPHLKQKAK